jgi:L-ascorbate 6-phosphate lactonase
MSRILYRHGSELVREIHETRLPASAIAVWSLGQAGVLVKGERPDEWVVFDPYLTSSIEKSNPGTEFKREFEPPLSPKQLAGTTAVLVTHHHDDHLDVETLEGVAAVSPETKFVVPAPHVELLSGHVSVDRTIPALAGKEISIKSFHVMPVPAAHVTYDTDAFGRHLYLGYCVTVGGIRLFHSGDTVVTPELVEAIAQFRPHVAFLPINGGDYQRTYRGIVGNMGFRDAADFAAAVHADLVIPVHYDMFPNNRDNPAYFVDYLFSEHRSQKFHMMAVGERYIYMA